MSVSVCTSASVENWFPDSIHLLVSLLTRASAPRRRQAIGFPLTLDHLCIDPQLARELIQRLSTPSLVDGYTRVLLFTWLVVHERRHEHQSVKKKVCVRTSDWVSAAVYSVVWLMVSGRHVTLLVVSAEEKEGRSIGRSVDAVCGTGRRVRRCLSGTSCVLRGKGTRVGCRSLPTPPSPFHALL